MYGLQNIDEKGRGLVSTQDIQSGQVVLQEDPLLLILEYKQKDFYCINCLKALPQRGYMQCYLCQHACFCSPQCRNTLTHSPNMCQAYRMMNQYFRNVDEDTINSLQLLLQVQQQVYAGNQGIMERLNYLSKGNVQNIDQQAIKVRQLLDRICSQIDYGPPLGFEQIKSVLKVEQSDAIGIMVNYQIQPDRYATRGSAIYMNTSLVNHECVPNLARFESFDSTPYGQTSDYSIKLIAMHDLPKGTELLISYVPLGWDYETRQIQCQEQYGFTCNCPRCMTESVLESYDENGTKTLHDEDQDVDLPEGALDPSYLQVYMMKYLCPITEDCEGTLAPIQGTNRYICNVCYGQRTEEDFLANFENGDENAGASENGTQNEVLNGIEHL